MKKAFLVTFEVTTRVIADVPEDFDPKNTNLAIEKFAIADDAITEKARQNILEEPEGYIVSDNMTGYEEDTECPYGTYDNEK